VESWLVGYSRPIPFAVKPAVREQITQMVNDDTYPRNFKFSFFNPFTVVSKEGKKTRICVDARKMNQFTIPDYESPSIK
jgi:hypothetical protein